MKSVFNSLKEPIIHCLKIDVLNKESVRTASVLTQRTKSQETEDKISISSDKELHEDRIFLYKPHIIQQKINDDFNYGRNFRLNNFNQFRINGSGLYNVLFRQFSTKVDKMNDIVPHINIGGDFAEMVTQSSVFADKTLFIKEIIENESKVILITMPRRWGKSLNLDMLRRFLEIPNENGKLLQGDKKENLNYKLFFGNGKNLCSLNIANQKLKISQKDGEIIDVAASNIVGTAPVIFIDFKDCKGSSIEEIKEKIKDKICNLFRSHRYLLKSDKLEQDEKNKINKYIFEEASEVEIQNGLKNLSALLHKHFDKKVWILIDEYDAATNKAYLEFNDKDSKEVSELFRSIYEPALKGNPSLEKGVITGVQYIVKSGMLSGLNNLSKYNVTSTKYSKYYGIDQEEMNILLEHFSISETNALKIKDWYNGYKSNSGSAERPNFIDKYNIWSVVNYLNKKDDGFKSYWENSSLGSVIDKKILKNLAIKDIVEGLVINQNLVLGKLTTDFGVDDFRTLKDIVNNHDKIEIKQDGVDLLFSYLFITGYLTDTGMVNQYALPNKEIKTEFEAKLKDYYSQIFNISPSKFNELTVILDSIFLKENTQEIKDAFMESFAPKLENIIKDLKIYNEKGEVTSDVKGVFANEDLMHSLLNNIAIQVVNAKFASERYTTKSNGEKGRADIALSKNDKGIVIEMKYNNTKEVGDKKLSIGQANKALEQAKSYSELIKDSDTKISIGCNITDKQELFLSGCIIDKKTNETINFSYPTSNL